MSYGQRRKRVLLDLAVATISDPQADARDIDAARRALVDGDRRLNFERLSPDELNTWRALQRRLLAERPDVIVEHPHDASPEPVCSRCARFSDEDLAELADAIAAGDEQEAPRG